MFAGTQFLKPSNARQAEASEQTDASGRTSKTALARLGLQVGKAPKPRGRQMARLVLQPGIPETTSKARGKILEKDDLQQATHRKVIQAAAKEGVCKVSLF